MFDTNAVAGFVCTLTKGFGWWYTQMGMLQMHLTFDMKSDDGVPLLNLHGVKYMYLHICIQIYE